MTRPRQQLRQEVDNLKQEVAAKDETIKNLQIAIALVQNEIDQLDANKK